MSERRWLMGDISGRRDRLCRCSCLIASVTSTSRAFSRLVFLAIYMVPAGPQVRKSAISRGSDINKLDIECHRVCVGIVRESHQVITA